MTTDHRQPSTAFSISFGTQLQAGLLFVLQEVADVDGEALEFLLERLA
jgi:hypothetical protein